jgi:hypothetical protein
MAFHNLRFSALAIIVTWGSALPASQLGEPRRDFRVTDFARIRWLEGTWKGSGGGYDAFYERYHFVNDSTIEMQSFTDGTLRTVSERNTIAIRNGRIYDESANGRTRYEAAKVTNAGIDFVPVRGATTSFQFTRMSKDRWTATIRPANGKKKTVYEMRRK